MKKLILIIATSFLFFIFSSLVNQLNAGKCALYYSTYNLDCLVCGTPSNVPSCIFNSEPDAGGDCYTGECNVCGNDGICF